MISQGLSLWCPGVSESSSGPLTEGRLSLPNFGGLATGGPRWGKTSISPRLEMEEPADTLESDLSIERDDPDAPESEASDRIGGAKFRFGDQASTMTGAPSTRKI